MRDTGYAQLLRQLRAQEKARNLDLTDRAMVVYNLRIESILNGPGTDEQKARLAQKATSQWDVFMERQMPANG